LEQNSKIVFLQTVFRRGETQFLAESHVENDSEAFNAQKNTSHA
jgi:hypothetical protein